MNTITLTIAATPDNLRRLAEAFGNVIDENFPNDATPALRISSMGPAEKTIESAEIRMPEAVAKPEENVAEAPEPAAETQETVAAPEKQGPAHTLTELRAKAAALVKGGHREEIKELLQQFGAPKVPELNPEDYDRFFEGLEAIA